MCCDRYAARMKTQTIINSVFAVAFVAYVVWSRNPTFDNITCKGWKVVDEDGKERIVTGTDQFGFCSVAFVDQNKKCGLVRELAPLVWLVWAYSIWMGNRGLRLYRLQMEW